MMRYFRLLVSMIGLCAATGAAAQEFPAGKPIKLVIPAAAGTQADVLSRVFIDRMRERLGWTIVPDFRAGGDMVPAINVLLQSPADGYTVLLNYMALTIQAAVKRDLPY